MLYNILAIADIHWGALEAKRLYNDLKIVLDTIEYLKDRIDMVVICGDYFDYKLQLNSKAALLSIQWMNELVDTCRINNIKKVRVFKGTRDHDNDQLEAFRNLEDDSGFFKIFNENTYEETLPGLGCIYCPDENIPTKDYKIKYMENIMKIPDIGFFHGSFDIVLPDIVVQQSEETNNTNVIFEYDVFSKLIKGPMIAGHWHTESFNNPLIYIGSFDRWSYGEEEPKGFIILQYNTETYEYSYKKIENCNARKYDTLVVDTMTLKTSSDYSKLINEINNSFDLTDNKLRITIQVSTDRPEDTEYINAFKKYYINNKNIKIDVKDMSKVKKKKEDKKQLEDINNKYGFILNKSLEPAKVIQEFILVHNNKSRTLNEIEKIINPYLNK